MTIRFAHFMAFLGPPIRPASIPSMCTTGMPKTLKFFKTFTKNIYLSDYKKKFSRTSEQAQLSYLTAQRKINIHARHEKCPRFKSWMRWWIGTIDKFRWGRNSNLFAVSRMQGWPNDLKWSLKRSQPSKKVTVINLNRTVDIAHHTTEDCEMNLRPIQLHVRNYRIS